MFSSFKLCDVENIHWTYGVNVAHMSSRFLCGMGDAAVYGSSVSVAVELFPDRAAALVGLCGSSCGFGYVAGVTTMLVVGQEKRLGVKTRVQDLSFFLLNSNSQAPRWAPSCSTWAGSPFRSSPLAASGPPWDSCCSSSFRQVVTR